MNLDKNLLLLISNFGFLIYLLLFAVIFVETGIVIFPFLPGDSLIFAAGALASQGAMNIFILFFIFSAAAILGDSLNYSIGRYFGKRLIASGKIKKEYMHRTERFYEKYGAKTIIMARFIPIIRTFAPFAAGLGKMDYKTFLTYNIIGGIGWVALFCFGGFFFGNIPFVKLHFTLMVILIILLSFIPVIIEVIRLKRKS